MYAFRYLLKMFPRNYNNKKKSKNPKSNFFFKALYFYITNINFFSLLEGSPFLKLVY